MLGSGRATAVSRGSRHVNGAKRILHALATVKLVGLALVEIKVVEIITRSNISSRTIDVFTCST